jgi:selenocysteine lyase/cysteine desulfurase
MDKWESFRAQFPVCDEYVYLNHAAVSPLPLAAKLKMDQYLKERTEHGAANYPDVIWQLLINGRKLGAQLLHTNPDQIFFVRSTSQGLGVAATGIPFAAGDNLVLVEKEFPANLRPWMPLKRRGVDLRMVPQKEGRVLIEDLAAAIDDRTRAVSLSFVQFLSGFRADCAAVGELCRKHDALFVVDAIQGIGAFDLDVEACKVDFISACSHKWLLGPEGAGLGYASPRALERIVPALEGWLAVENPFDFFDLEQPLKSTAARYEEGAYNSVGLAGMLGSLELLLSIGIDQLSERIIGLSDYVVEGLQERGWQVHSPRETKAEKSGIVLASKEGVDSEELGKKLKAEKIELSLRAGALRIAPHGYNTTQDLDRLLAVL